MMKDEGHGLSSLRVGSEASEKEGGPSTFLYDGKGAGARSTQGNIRRRRGEPANYTTCGEV